MSSYDYAKLLIDCQDTGKYHVFVFDIVGSSIMDPYSKEYQLKAFYMTNILKKVYDKIHEIELQEKKQILHESNEINMCEFNQFDGVNHRLIGTKRKMENESFEEELVRTRVCMREPFVFFDNMGITILRDTLDREIVYRLFDEAIDELGYSYTFHKADCYYETDSFSESYHKLWREDAIVMCTGIHKNKFKYSTQVKRLISQS